MTPPTPLVGDMGGVVSAGAGDSGSTGSRRAPERFAAAILPFLRSSRR